MSPTRVNHPYGTLNSRVASHCFQKSQVIDPLVPFRIPRERSHMRNAMPRRILERGEMGRHHLAAVLLLGVFGLIRLLSYLTQRFARRSQGAASDPCQSRSLQGRTFLGGLPMGRAWESRCSFRRSGPSPTAPAPPPYVSWLHRLAIWSFSLRGPPVRLGWLRLAMNRPGDEASEAGDLDGASATCAWFIIALGQAAQRSQCPLSL